MHQEDYPLIPVVENQSGSVTAGADVKILFVVCSVYNVLTYNPLQ